MTAFLLPAVVSSQRQSRIALPTYLLVATIFAGEGSEGRLEGNALGTTTAESEDEVKGGLYGVMRTGIPF